MCDYYVSNEVECKYFRFSFPWYTVYFRAEINFASHENSARPRTENAGYMHSIQPPFIDRQQRDSGRLHTESPGEEQ